MKTFSTKAAVLLGLILLTNPVLPQHKFEISGGFGFPELINARFRYGNNLQVGICYGFLYFNFFGGEVMNWSVAAEGAWYFAGHSKYTEQPPFYLQCGIQYCNFPVFYKYDSYDWAMNPRIGRVFNLSSKAGIKVDLGFFIPLSRIEDPEEKSMGVLFSGSAGLFLRF